MQEPWNTVITLILGPGGAIVALCVVIYFLWKLFREEQAENRANFSTVALQSKAIEALTIEVRAWREVYDVGPHVGPRKTSRRSGTGAQ